MQIIRYFFLLKKRRPMKETLKRHFESSLARTAEFELANTALGQGPVCGGYTAATSNCIRFAFR